MCCRSSVLVDTDPNLLRRLVQNLVSNAVKYTRRGRVVVGVRRRGDHAEIQVLDTGIGIAQANLTGIFDEFARLEEGALEAEGLGLGLSIVDRIARVLGASIAVQSEPGHGTLFTVRLRVSKASEADETLARPKPTRLASDLRGLTILAIDNEADILDGMEMLLSGWGCEVLRATGSADIRRTAGRLRFRISSSPTTISIMKPGLTRSASPANISASPSPPSSLPPTGPRKCWRRPQHGISPYSTSRSSRRGCGCSSAVTATRCGPPPNRPQRAARLAPLDEPSFDSRMTAWVRLSTLSFVRTAETCALMVASDTPSS